MSSIAVNSRPSLADARTTDKSSLGKMVRNSIFEQLAKIDYGSLTLVEGDQWHRFGQSTPGEIDAEVAVHDDRFYTALAFDGSLGAGESFLDGMWTSPNLVNAIRLLARNRETLLDIDGGMPWHRQLIRRVLGWRHRNSRVGSRRNIAAHYDLGNEFFELFLDPTMTYSCGVFVNANSILEEASREKYDLACRKLKLQADDRVFEIGCGWGGFAIHAAQNYGCQVTATTISQRQFEYAEQRIAAAGLTNRIELLQRDYRDLTSDAGVDHGSFDKLVSIEMIEAVGHDFLPEFFRVCGNLLRPDGEMLLQAITIPDQRYDSYRKSIDFIQKHIFPGGCLPSVSRMLTTISEETDLQPIGMEDFADDYAKTLLVGETRSSQRSTPFVRWAKTKRFSVPGITTSVTAKPPFASGKSASANCLWPALIVADRDYLQRCTTPAI